MRLWLTPMIYAIASIMCGFALPRFEHVYLGAYTLDVSVASVQAYLSAVASGMMALTGIVYSIAFVMVQFSAIAYSPRLVLWFIRDPVLFHSLGIFVATFTYSLSTLAWVDRAGSGSVPLFSSMLVVVMLVLSVIMFSRLVQSISNLQITNVLHIIGNRGRQVIRGTFRRSDETCQSANAPSQIRDQPELGPATQTIRYSGDPRTIASFDTSGLVRHAATAHGVIVMACAVGDTVAEGTPILSLHGGKQRLAERQLMRAVRLGVDRTFEQDPKYPIRLLVDIAIKALSPAINDPTTAVQAIDQIEDLLHRLGRCDLDTGCAKDAQGVLRLIYPMPTFDDYLTLAFDEIRQYGVGSVQVMRRLRSALKGVLDSLDRPERIATVREYLKHLDLVIERSPLDAEDKLMARREDRQGLGLSRRD